MRWVVAALLGALLGLGTTVSVWVFGTGVFWLFIFGDDQWPDRAVRALEVTGFLAGIAVFVATLFAVGRARRSA